MTMREPTPSTAVTTRRRPALHDVTRLAGNPVDDTTTRDGTDAGSAGPTAPEDAAASIRTQVEQVQTLLAAIRETVGSLAQASRQLEREVEQSVQAATPP